MTGLKKIAAVLTMGMSLSVFAGCGLVVKTDEAIARDEEKVRGVVLVEGDKGIKVTLGEVMDDYEMMLAGWTAQYGEENMEFLIGQLEQQKIQVMDSKMRNQLMEIKADEMSISKDSPELIKEYEETVKSNVEASGGQEKYDKLLAEKGFTAETYKAEVIKGLRIEKLLEEVTKDIMVEDPEINTYYEENKATDFTVSPGAKLYHIFFGKPDDATAEGKAKEAKAKLDGGADFAAIAKEYGQDSSKNEGGLLGTYPWDTQELGADFMAEAKKLTEGQISEPVKTSFGWHIIKVTDVVKEATVQQLTDKVTGEDGVERTVRDEIKNLLISNKKNKKIADLLDEWEAEYHVKRYPERIPMEHQPDPATTTPTDTTAPTATTTPAGTTPAGTTVPASTTTPTGTTVPASTTVPSGTTTPTETK